MRTHIVTLALAAMVMTSPVAFARTEDEVQAPRAEEIQAPRQTEDEVQAPRAEEIQAPRG